MSDIKIFPEETAKEFYSSLSGQKYQPSNGTEGMIFYDAFCRNCSKDGECEIMHLTMCWSPEDDEYPAEWVWTEEGQPTCTAFSE